ncbi:MAG: elongation factor G [Candidatus Omnitrophica bacterium]|nr:elongation factor G [Candidatus Omnitrophota bacterium]
MAKQIRNIALLSHSGAGKTSLSEALLFHTGVTKKLGSVPEGTTLSDYSSDEIERKISINASILHCHWEGCQINLIDTPGYADFISETIAPLYAIDGAIVVLDGGTGVEVGTERVWELLESRKIPHLLFINKLDKENASFAKTLAAIQEQLGRNCVPIQFPEGEGASFGAVADLVEGTTVSEGAQGVRDKLVEGIAEQDDALLEKYLEKGTLDVADIQKGLRSGVMSSKLTPILCGSSTKGDAVKMLLRSIVAYLPSPSERGAIKGKDPASGEDQERKADPKEPFSAQVFKTISDPYLGQLTIFRIFSGTLLPEATFYNVTRQTRERIGKIFLLQGKSQTVQEKAEAGEIVGVAKLKETRTGDSLADEKHPILFETIPFPEPAISVSVKPKTRTDEDKISDALSKLTAEDLSFRMTRDAQTKELILSGMGDLHLTVMVGRLQSRFGVGVEVGTPKVAYKETITRKVRVQGKYKKQSGGHGQYGDCWIQVEPLTRGANFEFVDKVVGGAIPRNYIPSVEKGVRQAMGEGVLAGYPLVDIKVTVDDGSFHPVDSSDLAFQIAGAMALRKAVLEASPVLLEPIMDVEVSIPEEYMGAVTGDLNSRRGKVLGMDMKTKTEVLHAKVPLAEILKYAPDLKSLTGGRGSYTMKFSHYEIVPQRFSQEIIQHAKVPVREAVE